MSIVGRWTMVSSEKYDEFLKAAGVGIIQRNVANKAHPTLEFIEQNGKWVIKTETTFKSFQIEFVLGEEFDEELADGRKSRSIITIEGNKLFHKQNTGSMQAEVTREVIGEQMISTFKTGNVVATRVFKRI